MDTFEVTVNNVAPTATLGNNGPVNEGSSATVSFSGPADVSSADTTAGFKYSFFDCANNTANLALDYATAGASASTSCTFNDNGTYTVAGRIFDKDDGYTDYTTSVTVNNVAPTATFNAPGSVDEGSAINLSLSAVSDPGSDSFEYRFSCDNGNDRNRGPEQQLDLLDDRQRHGPRQGPGPRRRRRLERVLRQRDRQRRRPRRPWATTARSTKARARRSASAAPLMCRGADTTAGSKYSFDCANNTADLALDYATAGASASAGSRSIDNGTYTVAGRIFDKDDGYTDYTRRDRQQRRPDSDLQRARQRRRGLGHQPQPVRGQRPGQRQLRIPLQLRQRHHLDRVGHEQQSLHLLDDRQRHGRRQGPGPR